MNYTCSQCGKMHQDWPAIGYAAPIHYSSLDEGEKERMCTITDDFCEIHHKDQTDRFIRTVLLLPVHDLEQKLEYGLWVSISQKSYEDYRLNFNSSDYETTYFGWICNNLIGYDLTLAVPTDVLTRKGNHRPDLKPHSDYKHPLVTDFYEGISKVEAEKRIHKMLRSAE